MFYIFIILFFLNTQVFILQWNINIKKLLQLII